MKQFFTLLPFLFLTVSTSAQSFLNGFVLDSTGNPIFSIITIVLYEDSTFVSSGLDNEIGEADSIWVRPPKYLSRADNTGAFHLLVEDEQNINIEVSAYNYITKIIHLDSLPSEPIVINMEIDSSTNNYEQLFNRGKDEWFYNAPDVVTASFDINIKRFGAFESLIGEHNVDALEGSSLFFTFGYGKVFSKIYTGLEFGVSTGMENEEDGIKIETDGTLLALHLGYELINLRKTYVMPSISFNRYWFRLINSPDVDEVPLQNYLQDRDLDLRFIQPTADIGLTIGYKYRGKNWAVPGFFLFGMSGGYAISLRDEAKIKGLRSKVDTEEGINVDKLALSFFAKAYFN